MDPELLEIKRRYKRQILDAMRDWPRRPADLYGPLQGGECWSPIPTHPADADVDANMRRLPTCGRIRLPSGMRSRTRGGGTISGAQGTTRTSGTSTTELPERRGGSGLTR